MNIFINEYIYLNIFEYILHREFWTQHSLPYGVSYVNNWTILARSELLVTDCVVEIVLDSGNMTKCQIVVCNNHKSSYTNFLVNI